MRWKWGGNREMGGEIVGFGGGNGEEMVELSGKWGVWGGNGNGGQTQELGRKWGETAGFSGGSGGFWGGSGGFWGRNTRLGEETAVLGAGIGGFRGWKWLVCGWKWGGLGAVGPP